MEQSAITELHASGRCEFVTTHNGYVFKVEVSNRPKTDHIYNIIFTSMQMPTAVDQLLDLHLSNNEIECFTGCWVEHHILPSTGDRYVELNHLEFRVTIIGTVLDDGSEEVLSFNAYTNNMLLKSKDFEVRSNPS